MVLFGREISKGKTTVHYELQVDGSVEMTIDVKPITMLKKRTIPVLI